MTSVYIRNTTDDRQLDPKTIAITQGAVTAVIDVNDVSYEGANIELLTDRDFIEVPDLHQPICEGDELYLDGLSREKWVVRRGWYEVDGNPAINGWYLESVPVGRVRSLYLKDLNLLTAVTPRTHLGYPTSEGG